MANTLGDVIRSYIALTGKTQQQLADLSYFLAEQRIINRPLDQRRISRAVTNAVDPHDGTLEALAGTLAHVLYEQGYDGASADDLLKHFRNVKEAANLGTPADLVSLDAELAPYPQWYRDMIIQLTRAIHRTISGTLERRFSRKKQTPDIPPADDKSE